MEQKDYNRLKVVLAEKKKPNKWLAENLEVTETTVARWTNNRQQPDLPTLYRIAKILEVAPCDLLEKGSEV
jgi:DNA-binding Xre family transcriptional regulator